MGISYSTLHSKIKAIKNKPSLIQDEFKDVREMLTEKSLLQRRLWSKEDVQKHFELIRYMEAAI